VRAGARGVFGCWAEEVAGGCEGGERHWGWWWRGGLAGGSARVDHTCRMVSLKPRMVLTGIIGRPSDLSKHLKINQGPNSLNILLIYSELINSNSNVSEMHA